MKTFWEFILAIYTLALVLIIYNSIVDDSKENCDISMDSICKLITGDNSSVYDEGYCYYSIRNSKIYEKKIDIRNMSILDVIKNEKT